jgi:hypothetical protein
MGHGWSQRRITVTCINPENTSLSPKTFDVGTDDDLKEEIATALGITRDALITRHNPHNGLRFFYVDRRRGAAAAAVQGHSPAPAVGGSGENHLAQGLMRKGDKNRDAPVIHGPCYVCKQCTERDAFASCFPEDFDVITGRSRVSAAEHLLVLGDLEEQSSSQTKRAKHDEDTAVPKKEEKEDEPPKKDEEPPAAPQAQPVKEEEEEGRAMPASDAADSIGAATDAGLSPVLPAVVVMSSEQEAEEHTLPAKLAPLRDMVYCQILLNGIKGGTATSRPPSPILLQKAEEEEQRLPVQSPIKIFAVPLPVEKQDIVAQEKETPPPMVDVEKKKKPRTRRKNDVCADNIVPEGVRRSSRLRK